jgi:outer membrane protein OmpA-like peptidoglycan-associated protein
MFTRIRLLILSLFLSTVGCVPNPTIPEQGPKPFQDAIADLTTNLLNEIAYNQGFMSFGKKNIMLVPFIDINSGDVVKASKQLESFIYNNSQTNSSGKFDVLEMNSDNLAKANYIMNGTIALQPYEKKDKHYQVSAVVWNIKDGTVLANQQVWIRDKNLDYEPVGLSKESPMYMKDKHFNVLLDLVNTPVKQIINQEYMTLLQSDALLEEAEAYYTKGNYKKALDIYDSVAQRKDSQEMMKTYAGLYKTNLQLGNQQEAENAFGKMVSLGIANDNLSVKFLFEVASDGFKRDKRDEFVLWLRQIGKRFSETGLCLNIEGHSSRSGTPEFNEKLSLERAESIQKRLAPYFDNVGSRTRAVGKGFSENYVGTGADDESDAVDRRVEFKIVQCR